MIAKLKPLLAEPLVHFLGAGLLIFLVLGGTQAINPDSRKITVTEAQVQQLAQNFAGIWRRPPTEAEIDRLIRNFIREEIYYREALKLGLDENDTIIRRRLRTKMEELATAEAQSALPSEAALQKLLDDNPAKYAADARYSFEHIWLGADGDAKAALAKIASGTAAKDVGQLISLPEKMIDAEAFEIERRFGEGFAAKLADVKTGDWAGPVTSGFGIHLVKVTQAKAAQKPKLADVRQALENDWRSGNVEKRKEAAFQALLEDYDIEIEAPE